MTAILKKIIAAAGGAVWRRPQQLRLSGHALFSPFAKPDLAVELDTYEMYRVFPQQNTDAHAANGKVRFDAFVGEDLFFQLKFDGQHSKMDLGELAKPYAVHFKWSNNFGFGILRFADGPGFKVEELLTDQVEGHPSIFLKVTDPKNSETFFAVDQETYRIRMVGFRTEVGYHHRIYSDFKVAENGFVQPTRMRMYFDGMRWIDVHWTKFVVNQPIADEIFSVEATT